MAWYLVSMVRDYHTLSELKTLASRNGNALPAGEHSQAYRSRTSFSESLAAQRSSGSTFSRAQPRSTFVPVTSNGPKHMAESVRRTHHRNDSSGGSDEWDFLSSFPAVPGTRINPTIRSAPTTPSKKWSVPHGVHGGWYSEELQDIGSF